MTNELDRETNSQDLLGEVTRSADQADARKEAQSLNKCDKHAGGYAQGACWQCDENLPADRVCAGDCKPPCKVCIDKALRQIKKELESPQMAAALRGCGCSVKTGACVDHKAQNELVSSIPEIPESDEPALCRDCSGPLHYVGACEPRSIDDEPSNPYFGYKAPEGYSECLACGFDVMGEALCGYCRNGAYEYNYNPDDVTEDPDFDIGNLEFWREAGERIAEREQAEADALIAADQAEQERADRIAELSDELSELRDYEEGSRCDSCAAAQINGIRVHETGCPRHARIRALEKRIERLEND